MAREVKYIIFEVCGFPEIFIFSEMNDHSDIARMSGQKVLSAGKCQIAGGQDGNVEVYMTGGSVTLNKPLNPEDKKLIEDWLNGPKW